MVFPTCCETAAFTEWLRKYFNCLWGYYTLCYCLAYEMTRIKSCLPTCKRASSCCEKLSFAWQLLDAGWKCWLRGAYYSRRWNGVIEVGVQSIPFKIWGRNVTVRKTTLIFMWQSLGRPLWPTVSCTAPAKLCAGISHMQGTDIQVDSCPCDSHGWKMFWQKTQTQDEKRYKELGKTYMCTNIHAEYSDLISWPVANACSSCALIKHIEQAYPRFSNLGGWA